MQVSTRKRAAISSRHNAGTHPAHLVHARLEDGFEVGVQAVAEDASHAQLVDVQAAGVRVIEDQRVAQVVVGRAIERFLACACGGGSARERRPRRSEEAREAWAAGARGGRGKRPAAVPRGRGARLWREGSAGRAHSARRTRSRSALARAGRPRGRRGTRGRPTGDRRGLHARRRGGRSAAPRFMARYGPAAKRAHPAAR